jgi:hypothetical protein
MDMIEKDRLIHGHPAKNWKDGIEERFCLKSITMVGNYGESDDDKNKN